MVARRSAPDPLGVMALHKWRSDLLGAIHFLLIFSPLVYLAPPARPHWKWLVALFLAGVGLTLVSSRLARRSEGRYGLRIVAKGRDGEIFSDQYQLSVQWERMLGKSDMVVYLSGAEPAIPQSERELFRRNLMSFLLEMGHRPEIV